MGGIPRWMVEEAQQTLFGEDKFIYKPIFALGITNVAVGQFFEQIAGQMLNCNVKLPVSTKWDTYPDLVKWNYKGSDLLFEVKCAHRNPLLAINQMRAYKSIIENEFPFVNAKVYYVLFFYTIHHFGKNFERYHDLFNALSQDIKICYILPLEIMFLLIKNLKPMATSWRNELVRWKLSTDKLFRAGNFLEPFSLLSGENSNTYFTLNNYKIRKKFISGIKLINYEIKKFPLIIVSSKGDGMLGLNRRRQNGKDQEK